jgi:toxin ParE1/3/4
MKLPLHRSGKFNADFHQQYSWYLEQADEALAGRFLKAVEKTLQSLMAQPSLGRLRKFRHPALAGIRSFRVEPPFQKLLIFYRFNANELTVERLMHSARDLPRRLIEP